MVSHRETSPMGRMEHVEYIDALKGFGMFLVVMGHVIAWSFDSYGAGFYVPEAYGYAGGIALVACNLQFPHAPAVLDFRLSAGLIIQTFCCEHASRLSMAEDIHALNTVFRGRLDVHGHHRRTFHEILVSPYPVHFHPDESAL